MNDVERSRFESTLLRRVRPRKVALFRASRIGDFICATPAFRALRAALPDAEISRIAVPLVAELAARCRSIDRFEAFPGMPGIAGQFCLNEMAVDEVVSAAVQVMRM
jgi:hypothetical protein